MTENDRAVRYSEMLESWAATTSKAKDGRDRFAASWGRSLRLGTALHPSPAGGARRDNEGCKVRNHANSS